MMIPGLLLSFSASSQTIKNTIDKAARDKATADKAAKADVLIHKTIIFDSTQIRSIHPEQKIQKGGVYKLKVKRHIYKRKKRYVAK